MAFGGYLKQSTAVDILLGPFLDDADGDTADTDATIDVELSKNGQALADSESAAPTHDAAGTVDGYYNCVLGTTDTNTLGILTVVAHHADDLPVRLDFQVVTANWFDTMCSTDILDVNVDTIKTQAVTCGAGVTVRADVGAAAAPGAANGMFIGGTNAATTVASFSCTGQLDAGTVIVDATMDVVGQLSVGNVLVDTTVVVTTDATISGDLLVTGTTTHTGNTSYGGTFDIVGAATANSVSIDVGFDVVGELSANSFLIDTTATVSGNVSLAGTFDVVGAATAGSVSIDAGFDVVGALSANSLLIDTTTTLTGNVSLGGTLGVTGITTFIGAVNANITGDITGNLSGSVGTCAAATVSAIGANAVTAAAIAAGAIDNATFAADVGNTAYATNIIALAVRKALDDYDPPTKGELDTAQGAVTVAAIADIDLSATMKASVNTEVDTALATTTYAEPGQETPPATTTLAKKLGYLYKILRNKSDNDGSTVQHYNDDAATVDHKRTVSEAGGTVTRAEIESGP